MREMKQKITVKDIEISVKKIGDENYISLTDIAKRKNVEDPSDVVKKWMSNKDSFDYYCLWEELFNPDFNSAESRRIKTEEVGYNAFTMSPAQWKKRTNAVGIVPSAGKYSVGTFAHPDIALEFASWIDTAFKLYLVKEFKRLKSDEQQHLQWSARREFTKINYLFQTDAIKEHLITKSLTLDQISYTYASEADILNVALFGKTAREWRDSNPNLDGNIRDHATIYQLLVLANMESHNSEMIKEGLPASARIVKLNEMARHQLQLLMQSSSSLLVVNKEKSS